MFEKHLVFAFVSMFDGLATFSTTKKHYQTFFEKQNLSVNVFEAFLKAFLASQAKIFSQTYVLFVGKLKNILLDKSEMSNICETVFDRLAGA